jgi:ADP-ribose pyrophosphatase
VRPTRPSNSSIDAVGIVAILEKATGPELLLQKQYRPPIDKVCIEVPAGLVDEGEDAETCALRELKEETGYVGEVIKGTLGVTPVMFNGIQTRRTRGRYRD